jgi:hypothetical protein
MGATGAALRRYLMAKFEGTPEEMAAYQKGIEAERERILKILRKFHQTFGSGDIAESTTMMETKYMYNFIIDARPVK